ncbi:vitamin K epoxide reductase [Acidobacteria bacterium AB60]|nr:vitamin K epoxide reductase [Acidobacteria bacterium AB60]
MWRNAGGLRPGLTINGRTMRYLLTLLALAGLTVSYLALRVHYSNDVEPCDINAHWDCGVVNHSPFAMIGPVPVAAIGMAGYVLLGALAMLRKKALTTAAAVVGLGFALYLTHIEKDILMVWCLYCVISQSIILLITILSGLWLWSGRRRDIASAR